MRKTYIVSGSQVRFFQHELIKNKEVLMGVQVLPFEAACLSSNLTSHQLEIKAYKALQEHSFELLERSLKSPSLIKALIAFRIELLCYGISLDDLPNTTQREQELFKAFSILEPLIPTLTMPKDTVYYALDGLTHAQQTFLLHNNATSLSHTIKEPTKVEAYEALNFRQELEGAVQMILKENYDNAVLALFNYESSAPYVESCFQRYGIDVHLQNRSFDVVKNQMLALIHFYTHQDVPSILNLIESGALGLKKPYKVIRYIQHYKLHLNQLTEPFDYAAPSDMHLVRDILDLQQAVQEDSLRLREAILELQDCSLQSCFTYALNQLASIHGSATKPLIRYVQDVYPFIDTQSLPVIMKHIESLQDKPKKSLSVQVVDVNAIPTSIEGPLFILGLSSKAYPNLSSLSGVLDERYVQEINGYPTLEQRNKYKLEQKRAIFQRADHLILSFPHATYEGKGLEAAYDAEVLLEKYGVTPKAWHIQEALNGLKPTLSLSPELAQAIYVKDGKIRGSVSAFELYVQDPVAYFLRYGLNLQEPPRYELDARLFGTLNHAYFERALTQKSTHLWDVYESYLPHNDATHALIRELNDEVLAFHLDNINQAQATTRFTPTYFEHRFKDAELFEGLSFSGIIDRIDEAEGHLMVVDYKSSYHSLKSDAIQTGQQLQLLTYALIARAHFQLPIQGVFYYSLNKNAIAPNTYGYSKTKGISVPSPLILEDLQKAHTYQGWFLNEPDDRFFEATYYSGLMQRKKDESFYIYGKPYDIEKVKEYFVALYAYLRNQILSGVLDVNAFRLPLFPQYSFKQGGDDDESEV